MHLKANPGSVICFDLDDTLYNEIDFLKSAFQAIAQLAMPEQPLLLYGQMLARYRTGQDAMALAEMVSGIPKDQLLTAYRSHFPLLQPFPGVLQLLNSLKHCGAHTAIITDGRSITQRNKIRALGLETFIDLVIISEEINSEKPAMTNFTMVHKAFPQASAFSYIADNLHKDFIAPRQLGWSTYGKLDNGMNIHKDSALQSDPARLPDYFFMNFREFQIN